MKYFVSLDSSLKEKQLIVSKSCITAVPFPPLLLSIPKPLGPWLSKIAINFQGQDYSTYRVLERKQGALANG